MSKPAPPQRTGSSMSVRSSRRSSVSATGLVSASAIRAVESERGAAGSGERRDTFRRLPSTSELGGPRRCIRGNRRHASRAGIPGRAGARHHRRIRTRGIFQTIDAGINSVIFFSIAVYFLLTIETRLKRRRALRTLHQLRSLAHVVDMHQLTKDPEQLLLAPRDTPSSPRAR